MTASKKGSLTILLALTSLLFLTFCLVLAEGTRNFFLKAQAAQAMELAQFSVLSEYQQELLEHYGLFFLDLDYEKGAEHTGVLEQRAKDYFHRNAEEIMVTGLEAGNFRRASDSGGMPFFYQAVEQMKVESGYKIFEGLFENLGDFEKETVDLGGILEESENAAEGILGEYVDEEGLPLFEIVIPKISFPSIGALTEAVFGSESGLSEKTVNSEDRISVRDLSRGIGMKKEISFADLQLFHGYLFRHCNYYGAQKPNVWKESLEYQLEYIISGEAGDKENLENIMWRIFLLRTAGNYLFYHQDGEKLGKAEAEAAALVGITGNAALISLVKEIILISQAIEDGISETKRVFAGEKVPVYQQGIFSGIEIGYEEYLYLFLCTAENTGKIYRMMDIAELEIREKSGYQGFRLDHCTDSFDLRCTYRFESLFRQIPLMDGGTYENVVHRKVCYEM